MGAITTGGLNRSGEVGVLVGNNSDTGTGVTGTGATGADTGTVADAGDVAGAGDDAVAVAGAGTDTSVGTDALGVTFWVVNNASL